MCGLVGFSGKYNFDPVKIKFLLLYNETRGKHSYGIYNGNVSEKGVGLVSTKLAQLEIEPSKLLIGHTRQATGGAHTINNAHPYTFGSITGAHNGVVRNVLTIKKLFSYNNMEEVDSKYIFAIMNKTKDLTVLKHIDAAAALIFSSKENPNELYVIRNSERPLFRGTSPEGIYLSSIKESLEVIDCTDIKEVKENTLYVLENGAIKNTRKLKLGEKAVKDAVHTTTTTTTNNHTTYYASTDINSVIRKLQVIKEKLDNNIQIPWFKVNTNVDKNLYTLPISGAINIVGFTSYNFKIKTNNSVGYFNVNSAYELRDIDSTIFSKRGDYLLLLVNVIKAGRIIAKKGSVLMLTNWSKDLSTFEAVLTTSKGDDIIIDAPINSYDCFPLTEDSFKEYVDEYGIYTYTSGTTTLIPKSIYDKLDLEEVLSYIDFYDGKISYDEYSNADDDQSEAINKMMIDSCIEGKTSSTDVYSSLMQVYDSEEDVLSFVRKVLHENYTDIPLKLRSENNSNPTLVGEVSENLENLKGDFEVYLESSIVLLEIYRYIKSTSYISEGGLKFINNILTSFTYEEVAH